MSAELDALKLKVGAWKDRISTDAAAAGDEPL